MKIYASMRGDLTSLDYYIDKDLWVKVYSKYDGNYFYAKILSLDKRGVHYLYYIMNLIPEHWVDEDNYRISPYDIPYKDRQTCRSTDDIRIITPVEVLTDIEIQHEIDSQTMRFQL